MKRPSTVMDKKKSCEIVILFISFYRFNTISIKIPGPFFPYLEKESENLYESIETKDCQSNPEQKEIRGEIQISNSMLLAQKQIHRSTK